MKLSLLAIMLDEEAVVPRWLDWLARAPAGMFGEVVVVDGGSIDQTLPLLRQAPGLKVRERPFPMDFAGQRNHGIDLTSGDWIFEVDADEVPSVPLLHDLGVIIDQADVDGVDCVGFPRLNFHDGVLQASPGAHGLDYQYRLHRRHVRWYKPVHEELAWWHARTDVDISTGRFICHMKTQARYEARNEMYRRMAT